MHSNQKIILMIAGSKNSRSGKFCEILKSSFGGD